jgi:hypothetical protein
LDIPLLDYSEVEDALAQLSAVIQEVGLENDIEDELDFNDVSLEDLAEDEDTEVDDYTSLFTDEDL